MFQTTKKYLKLKKELDKMSDKIYFWDGNEKIEALNEAVLYGNIDIIECLLEYDNIQDHDVGAEIETNIFKYLSIACETGNLSVIKFLYEDCSHIKCSDAILRVAASQGQLEIMKYFISKGHNVNEQDLYNAAQEGHLNIVQYLIEDCKNTHFNDHNYAEALRRASACGRLDIENYITEKCFKN